MTRVWSSVSKQIHKQRNQIKSTDKQKEDDQILLDDYSLSFGGFSSRSYYQ